MCARASILTLSPGLGGLTDRLRGCFGGVMWKVEGYNDGRRQSLRRLKRWSGNEVLTAAHSSVSTAQTLAFVIDPSGDRCGISGGTTGGFPVPGAPRHFHFPEGQWSDPHCDLSCSHCPPTTYTTIKTLRRSNTRVWIP